MQGYAPTCAHTDEDIDSCYATLEDNIGNATPHTLTSAKATGIYKGRQAHEYHAYDDWFETITFACGETH